MKETRIAVAGIAVLAGGCSLSSPGTTGALGPRTAPLAISAEAPKGLGPVIEDRPDQPVAPSTQGGVEPIAALSASARARTKWETLNPNELANAPVATGRPATETTSTLAAAPAARSASGNYDRDAAMQSLIKGGKAAGKRICDGC